MRVTPATILREEKYAPVPGTEYDVADGHVVKLRRPTFGLRAEFLTGLETRTDIETAKMVTAGEWPEESDCDPVVVARICEDFFCAATPTWRPGSPLQRVLDGSTSSPAPANTPG